MMKKNIITTLALAIGLWACTNPGQESLQAKLPNLSVEALAKLEQATFAGGCFWCTEAVFERVKGVEDVISGYSGGSEKDADYKKVSYGLTDHAECVQIYFDPEVITYKELVKIFMGTHDPTTLNRQGPDVGAQYRSEIFFHNDLQKQDAVGYIKELETSNKYKDPIVTKVTALDAFYPAEDYHQDYYRLNPDQPYIVAVAKPKVAKFKKNFSEYEKEPGS